MCHVWSVIHNSLFAEQLGGAVTPATQEPPHSPPALFGYVGPSVDEWEEHLRSIADELDKHQDGITDTSSAVKSNEEKIFLQVILFVLKTYQRFC